MIDTFDKLAASATFVIVGGKIQEQADSGGMRGPGSLLANGTLIDGKYRVIRRIGRGGMGAVYKVHHELLKKDMALKTISARTITTDDWQRFQREAQAIARLRHKNIVEVFDFGISEDRLPYYTMELLDGESLAQRLANQGHLDTMQALHIFLQVAEAMTHAHKLQIVHRDIKPGNILLSRRVGASENLPAVKLVDFGTAKLVTDTSVESQYATRQGTIFGSPLYMSPEQSLGDNIDFRSDIYSFGCSLFHALAGAPPFSAENAFLTMMRHQKDRCPTLRDINPSCFSSQRLDGLISKLLAKKPAGRLQSFEAVIEEIKYCLPPSYSVESASSGRVDAVLGADRPGPNLKDAASAVHSDAANLTDTSAAQKASANFRDPDTGGYTRKHQKNMTAYLTGAAAAVALICLAGVLTLGLTRGKNVHSGKTVGLTSNDSAPGIVRSIVSNPGDQRVPAGIEGGTNAVGRAARAVDRAASDVDRTAGGVERATAGDGSRSASRTNSAALIDSKDIETPVPFPRRVSDSPAGQVVTFTFPKGDNCAQFAVRGRHSVPCSGEVTVPANGEFFLVGREGLSPSFLRRFRSDDIRHLHLLECVDGEWKQAHIEAISRLTGLIELDISDGSFDSRCLPYIDKLVNLKTLKVGMTKIDAADLTRLSILPHLKMLAISGLKNVPTFLRNLPPTCQMRDLIATSSEIGDDDTVYLTKLPLHFIGLDNNNITDKGIATLAKIETLSDLFLKHNPFGPGSIDAFHRMKQLANVKMDISSWSAVDQSRMRHALPNNCRIEENTDYAKQEKEVQEGR